MYSGREKSVSRHEQERPGKKKGGKDGGSNGEGPGMTYFALHP